MHAQAWLQGQNIVFLMWLLLFKIIAASFSKNSIFSPFGEFFIAILFETKPIDNKIYLIKLGISFGSKSFEGFVDSTKLI